jgi:Uma2 family endonuclease
MGKNSPHVTSLIALVLWLQQAFGAQFVRFEAPIDVSPDDNEKNEPEPDAVVLKREYFHFATRNPQPRDLQLVVEVSDSSLAFDLTTKAALYARAEIAEYWVLDVNRRRLIVHRTPADGKYHSVEVYGENESVSPLAAATAEFRPVYAFPASVQ